MVVFSLTRWCWYIQTEFHRLRHTHHHYDYIRLQDYHLLWLCFPITFCSFPHNFMGCSAFARHYLRNNYCSLFLRLLRCFSSAGYLHTCVWRQVFNLTGCPIRTSMDLYSFAVPHSFSQLTTSFIVSKSLGIPRTPLFASYSYLTSHANLSTNILIMQYQRSTQSYP